MDSAQKLAIEQECRDLVTSITYYGDHGDVEMAVDLFVEDGSWLRGGKPHKGRKELTESYHRGKPTNFSRHVAAPTMIFVKDADHAEGVTYYIALNHDPGTPNPTFPLPFDPPFSMGEWHDKFVRTKDGWRFSSRETRRFLQRKS